MEILTKFCILLTKLSLFCVNLSPIAIIDIKMLNIFCRKIYCKKIANFLTISYFNMPNLLIYNLVSIKGYTIKHCF